MIRILLIPLLILVISCTPDTSARPPVASGGVIDLSGSAFGYDDTYPLDGEWKLYPGKLLSPDDLTSDAGWYPVPVPEDWKNLKINGTRLKAEGSGTYRLRLLLPENVALYGLKLPIIWSSYRLWVNGHLTAESGKVSENIRDFIPRHKPQTAFFTPKAGGNEIVIQITNYYDAVGGIWKSIRVGESKAIIKMATNRGVYNLFIFGGLILFSFYHIFIFLFRKKDLTPLIFGLFCFLISIRSLVTDENFIVDIMPWLSWFIIRRIEMLSFYLALPTFLWFTHLQFKKYFNRRLIQISTLAMLVFSLTVIFLPMRVYAKTLNTFQLLTVITVLFIIIRMIYAITRRQESALAYFTGYIIFAYTVIHDILLVNGTIKGLELTPLGLYIFVFAQSLILSRQYSSLFNTNEKLTRDLQAYSAELENKVAKRTRELEEVLQEKKNLFINIAHETKTPLTLISNYIDRTIKLHGASTDLKIIQQNINKLKRDMINFLDAEKLERGQVFYNHHQINHLSAILSEKVKLFEALAITKKIRIISNIENHLYSKIDQFSFDRIINNLLDNAMKYSLRDGLITVELIGRQDKIILSVSDTGIGMTEDQVSQIFKPFYQISHEKRSTQGIGMGLTIVYKILQEVNADIRVESRPEEGSRFMITFNRYYPQTSDKVENVEVSAPMDMLPDHVNISDTPYNSELKSILLVEDNPQMIAYLVSELKEDYNLFIAINGLAAINKIQSIRKPDIILSDVMMDLMDGHEFFQAIMKDPRFNTIPFIFLTAKTSVDEKIRSIAGGALDFITKPFSIEELKSKIASLIGYRNRQKKSIIRETLLALDRQMDEPDTSVNPEVKRVSDNSEHFKLTARQKEIAELLLQGCEYKEIAGRLGVSVKTIDNQIQNIYSKTGARNKIELINILKG